VIELGLRCDGAYRYFGAVKQRIMRQPLNVCAMCAQIALGEDHVLDCPGSHSLSHGHSAERRMAIGVTALPQLGEPDVLPCAAEGFQRIRNVPQDVPVCGIIRRIARRDGARRNAGGQCPMKVRGDFVWTARHQQSALGEPRGYTLHNICEEMLARASLSTLRAIGEGLTDRSWVKTWLRRSAHVIARTDAWIDRKRIDGVECVAE
jgi:hypothetical protein